MARRKEPTIPDAILDQLLAGADAKTAFDPGGLLDGLKKALAERALNAEMAPQALDWYLPRWREALEDHGFLVMQDFGKLTHTRPEDVLRKVGDAGFRALAQGQGQVGGATLHRWNLLLVTGRHPEWERAKPVAPRAEPLADHPVVRSVYGLDRIPGERPQDLAALLVA